MSERTSGRGSWLWALALTIWALAVPAAMAATQYHYDAQGRLIAVIYDSGERIDYAYDPAGNRTTVVTSTATNVPPVANDDAISVQEGSAGYTFDPRPNDTDSNGGTLEVVGHTDGDRGTVSRTTTSLTYDVAQTANGPGTDTFVYSLKDPAGASDTAVVAVTITNVAPNAVNDALSAQTQTLITFDPRSNDSDPGPDALYITGITQPAHGTAGFTPTSLFYISANGYTGTDSFTYTLSDPDGGADTATVSVTVSAANHPPVANDDGLTVAVSGSRTIDPRTNDTDPNGNPLTITGKTDGAHGTVTFSGSSVTYTPASGYAGSDGFTYTVSDGAGGTDTANVLVSVVANTAPDAVNDSLSTPVSTAATFDPRVNDTDAEFQALIVTAVSTPSHGSASVTGGGASVTYTPTTGYSGADSFTYTIQDTAGASDTATVSVTVSGANSPPDAVNDQLEAVGPFGQSAVGQVDALANDTDPNSQTLTITATTNGTKGTTSWVGGVITYTTNTGSSVGTDSFTYTISDGAGGTDTATVTVSIQRE